MINSHSAGPPRAEARGPAVIVRRTQHRADSDAADGVRSPRADRHTQRRDHSRSAPGRSARLRPDRRFPGAGSPAAHRRRPRAARRPGRCRPPPRSRPGTPAARSAAPWPLALLIFVTVVLVLFVMFNTQTVDISLVFTDVEAPLVLALVIAAVLGGLVVALLGAVMRAGGAGTADPRGSGSSRAPGSCRTPERENTPKARRRNQPLRACHRRCTCSLLLVSNTVCYWRVGIAAHRHGAREPSAHDATTPPTCGTSSSTSSSSSTPRTASAPGRSSRWTPTPRAASWPRSGSWPRARSRRPSSTPTATRRSSTRPRTR